MIDYRDVSVSSQHLDHYTLSVCLFEDKYYTYDLKSRGSAYDICDGYEMSMFHKYTGWGNWLRMNKQAMNLNPYCGGGLETNP